MDEQLTCKLCEKYYNEPVILPCNDCMCYSCLVGHLELHATQSNFDSTNQFQRNQSSEKNKFECPICFKTLFLSTGHIKDLPRYTIVEPIIQKLVNGGNDNKQVDCNFCEDYSKQRATLQCVQCNFTYCGNCFDTFHISKGPLAKHEIVEPFIEKDIHSDHICFHHNNEPKKLFCLTCGVCICFICKEIGEHHGHKTEIVFNFQLEQKKQLTDKNDQLSKLNEKISTCLQESDDFCVFVKKVGLETEAHVIRECDQLITIIEAQKESRLEEISKEFNNVIDGIANFTTSLSSGQQKLSSLNDIITSTVESEDHVAVLESSTLLKSRSEKICTKLNSEIRTTRKHFSQVPFDGMVLDFYQLKKDLHHISWLQPPGAPRFKTDKCYIKNNTAYLKWEGKRTKHDSYYLERSDDSITYKLIYKGKDMSINVKVEYNELTYFRLYAVNGAGKGSYSREIALQSPKGLNMRIDSTKTCNKVTIHEDQLSFSCKHSSTPQHVYTDAVLEEGCHYWKYRMVEVCAPTSSNGSIAVGLCNTEQIGSEICEVSYEVNVNLASKPIERNKKNIVCIHRTPEDIQNYDFTFQLNLHERYFDVYINGMLIRKDVNRLHTFEDLNQKEFVPYITIERCQLTMSILDNLQIPMLVPDKPSFDPSNCYSDNVDIVFEWFEDSIATDAYLLEIHQNVEDEEAIIAYRGNSSSFTYNAEQYDKVVCSRLYAVNMIGRSECSEMLTMKTSKGLSFSIQDEKNVNLQLWSSNRSAKYSSPDPLLLFGDIQFNNGLHFWKISIEQFEGKQSKLGFGLAQRHIKCVDFGARDSYCILLTSEEKQECPLFTISKCLRKKSILQSEFACLLNMEKRRFYCYLNGMMITKPVEEDLLLNIPRSIWSFSNVKAGVYPAILTEGNVKFSLICNQQMPKCPGHPTFGDCYCENISCNYTWDVSTDIGSYSNYFILKVAMFKLGKTKKTEAKYREVYRGPNTNHVLKQVDYNSKIVAIVTAVNLTGESKESEKVVLFSAKGFFFQFNKETKTDQLQLGNDGKTIVLKSLIHSFVLGNRIIKQGFHSWRIKIEKFEEQNKMAVVGVGISKSKLNDPILGEDQFTYGVQIIQHPKINIRHTKHRFQLQMSSEEACKTDIVVEVNLDENWMNLFVNGSQLRMDTKTIGSPTFNNVTGEFYPAVSLYGSKVQLSIANTTDDEEN